MDTTKTLEDALAQHEQAVYTYFRRLGLQEADAADLAQTTFLRALRAIDGFRGESSVKTWMLGIARNVFREWLRDKRRRPGGLEDVETEVSDRSTDADVRDALSRLDVDAREILVLRHVLDMPNHEIALLLDITNDAVRQRVSRAAADFRAQWSPT